jgi:hypothetical protein
MNLFAASELIPFVTVALILTSATFDNIAGTTIDCEQMVIAAMSS